MNNGISFLDLHIQVDRCNKPNGMDFLSNGIKMRNNFGDANYNNETYIYMAFAEEPLVGDNPATAR